MAITQEQLKDLTNNLNWAEDVLNTFTESQVKTILIESCIDVE